MPKQTAENPNPEKARQSPKQYMRARRPERFSDSVTKDEPILDRSRLEYHLNTMTSRSQEVAFATFARHLAEHEICPNLLPQTGPTGGGDSKVDAETYPVVEALALGWYVGTDAASQRWGFAFSAKKQWKAKVISDVNKAVKTGRGYAKMFFVSNQFIRDKERAEVEDQLRAAHGLDVRILDRTWIMDRVFANERQALAIEHLQLAVSIRKETQKGPRDTQRELDLQETEQRIQSALADGSERYQLVEDCLEAAELARGLERPRAEIDGLFARAERIARKCGTSQQRLKCAYQRAWTAYWWHEDFEHLADLYEEVEQRARGTYNVYDLELLSNIWMNLHFSVTQGAISYERSGLATRTNTLLQELERLSKQEDQPSGVLHARTLRLYMQLHLRLAANEPVEPTLGEFAEVLRNCEGLVGFPLQPLIAILTELGELLGGSPAYDELFEAMLAVQTRRKGDIAAAQMLLTRGAQQLGADRPYDAICTLGQSLRRLYKHESRGEAIHALYLCGCAYERVGLLWAARGTLLSAASLATSELWKYGEVTRSQAACYRRLKWIELQLGRVPQTLSWHEADAAVRHILIDKETVEDSVSEEEIAFDAILGILFLKAEHSHLSWLSALPDILDRLGLFSAWAALMYALGYEDELRATFYREIEKNEDMHSFFLKWRDQPASSDLPKRPSLYEEQKVTLKSQLLGCDIAVSSENVSPCVELAESILAALESLLSTATVKLMGVREPILTIDICKSEFAQQPFEFELQDHTGRPHINILCGTFEAHNISRATQEELKEKLFRLLATIFARLVATDNVEELLERMLREELALDRSISFTGSFVTVANVLGNDPRNRISAWADLENHTYPPKRSSAWDSADVGFTGKQDPKIEPLLSGEGDPPPHLLDHSQVRQSEIRTVSLIRESLWDKAKWVGTFFATALVLGDDAPPVLGLIFTDSNAAGQIFRFLAAELGVSDAENRLRVSILRGIDKANPYWYRVLIGSNLNSELREQNVKYITSVTRFSTMQPNSGANLDRFLFNYARVKSYILTAVVSRGDHLKPAPIDCPHLSKRELNVRHAWEVARHEPEMAGILPNDVPIIPADQKNPPVAELLQWKLSRSKERPG